MSVEAVSALGLSIRVAIVATILNALIGIPVAYLLARRTFRGRALVDLLVTLPLVLPPTVTGYYLIVLLGRRGWLGGPVYQLTGWGGGFTLYAAVRARPPPRRLHARPLRAEDGAGGDAAAGP